VHLAAMDQLDMGSGRGEASFRQIGLDCLNSRLIVVAPLAAYGANMGVLDAAEGGKAALVEIWRPSERTPIPMPFTSLVNSIPKCKTPCEGVISFEGVFGARTLILLALRLISSGAF